MRRSVLAFAFALVALGVGLGAEDFPTGSITQWSHQLSLPPGASLDARTFSNRPSVKELIIADEHANHELDEVVNGSADWSAKASAIYILWRNHRVTFISKETASGLFSNGAPELRPFAAAIIESAYISQATPDDPAIKWWNERRDQHDPSIDQVLTLLDTPPDWSTDETRRRIGQLLPALLTTEQGMFMGWRETVLIAELGDAAVPPVQSALAQAKDESVKKRLITALGQTNSALAVETLRALLRDPSEPVRGTALLGLKHCLGADALPELRYAAASDPDPRGRELAQECIQEIMKSPSPHGDNTLHPTPSEWLQAHRDWANRQTLKQNEPFARAVEAALKEAESKQVQVQPPPPSVDARRPVPVGMAGTRWDLLAGIGICFATLLLGVVAILVHKHRRKIPPRA